MHFACESGHRALPLLPVQRVHRNYSVAFDKKERLSVHEHTKLKEGLVFNFLVADAV
jgi:hypothetical protein